MTGLSEPMPAAAPRDATEDSGRARVLIADDLPENQIVYRSILEGEGYELITVSSGRDALRELMRRDFAVVLLDVNMPEMDGFETASLIRVRRKSAHTPIIFVTAYPDELHAVRGYEHGAVDYMLAPVQPDVLRTKVRVFVELQQREQRIRRQAEDRVALAEEQRAALAAMLEATTDFVARFTRDGRALWVNRAGCATLGVAPERVGQLTLADCHPSRLGAWLTDALAVARAGGTWVGESVLRGADGREIPVSQVILAHREADGQVEYYSTIARDLSARIAAEAALRESQQRQRLALAAGGLFTWQLDLRSNVLTLEMRRRGEPQPTRSVEIGRFLARVHPDDAAGVAEWLHRAQGREGEQAIEFRYLIRRQAVWVAAHAGMIDGNDAPRLLGVWYDATARKQVEQELHRHREELAQLVDERTAQLERSNERLRISERMAAIGTLAAGIGHDLGNLLLPVRMRLDALGRYGELSNDVREDLTAIRKSAEYLQRLTGGLRSLAADPETSAGDVVRLRLTEWWADAETLLRNVLPRNVMFTATGLDQVPEVAIARPAFAQAMFNLVQNAADALRDRGTGEVRIEASARGDEVVVTVRDDGPGMSDEVRRRCLEPFFTTKTRRLSTGLGLALVHRVVEQVGGRLDIESVLGCGTTFRLVLPVAAPLGQSEPGGARVAVEIGEPRLRAYVQSILRSLRCELVEGTERAELRIADREEADPARTERTVVLPTRWRAAEVRARVVQALAATDGGGRR